MLSGSLPVKRARVSGNFQVNRGRSRAEFRSKAHDRGAIRAPSGPGVSGNHTGNVLRCDEVMGLPADRSTNGRATIRDIATRAGVSITTVSRVLNDRPDVASETREAVLEVIRELNFTSNRALRSAPSGRTGLVGVTIPMVLGDYFAQLITGFTEALVRARPAGRPVPDVPPSGSGRSPWSTSSSSGRSTARSWCSPTSRPRISCTLQAARLPVRRRRRGIPARRQVPARRRREHGRRDRGDRAPAPARPPADRPHQGHPRFRRDRGPDERLPRGVVGSRHPAGPALETFGEFRTIEGRAGGRPASRPAGAPTAIFACNDEMAVSVLQEARARGIRVPEDLSVVGFDDTMVAQIAAPALTTVHQPLEEVGRMAVNLLARIIDEPPAHPIRLEVGTRLVVRESTGPAPAPAPRPDQRPVLVARVVSRPERR